MLFFIKSVEVLQIVCYNITMKSVGEKIKQLRIQAGLTQKQLGDILHVSYQAVSKWERGVGLPDVSLFPLIAKTLNTTVAELFDEKTNLSDGENFKVDGEKEKDQNVQKSAYKPVNRKFLLIGMCVILSVVTIILAIVMPINYANKIKNQIESVIEIYNQESNIKVTAQYKGKNYVFIRKYFFDGRLLYYYTDFESENYFYKDVLYTVINGEITENNDRVDVFSVFPNFIKIDIDKSDLRSVKRVDNSLKFKLKSGDNRPIAPLFGFTTDAKLQVFVKNQKLNRLVVLEGENALSMTYLFGYDFTLSLPSFITP